MSNPTFVEIACAGCGRTQRVRASKVIPCDGYTCSLSGCKKNPDFKVPPAPEGYVCTHIMNVAGGFSGWVIGLATDEDKRSIERAKAIRDAGRLMFLRRN